MATAQALKRDGKAEPEVAVAAGDGGRREQRLAERASALFRERREHGLRRMDRMFLFLMLGQWVFAILLAVFFSPYAWAGKTKAIHLSFYYDWAVLLTATVVVAADHLARQILWPESVYGIVNPEWWRFLEHAFWVLFENTILVVACVAGIKDMKRAARQQAEVEVLVESDELKSLALEMALEEARR